MVVAFYQGFFKDGLNLAEADSLILYTHEKRKSHGGAHMVQVGVNRGMCQYFLDLWRVYPLSSGKET